MAARIMTPIPEVRADTFTEAADLIEDLPQWLRIIRTSRRMGLREVAEQTGLSTTAVSSAERGTHTQTHTTIQILRWLGSAA